MLPDYISKAVPNPQKNRAPWYVNTAPSYAGIFLWIAFYANLGKEREPGGRGALPCRRRAGGPALLRALLLCARDAWHEDRLPAVRGGQLDIRHDRRLYNAGPFNGIAPDRLVPVAPTLRRTSF